MRNTILARVLGGLAFAALAAAAPLHAAPNEAAAATAAEPSRALLLQGGQNFRDLGGYRTRDGRTVRWRMLLRSGAMNHLTAADFDYLAKLKLRTVVDLRSTEERQAAPVPWPDKTAPHILTRDYRQDAMGLEGIDLAKLSGETARARMAAIYPGILEHFNDQYRELFDRLLADDAPLAFNCSAGKDRTGVAAALILTALDVPRETIIEDYLLSNQTFRPDLSAAAADPAFAVWRQLPADVSRAFMGVDRSYIEGVFRVIDAHPGGAEGYLRDRLGLDAAALATLRSRYTVAG
ncbi:tyrosine-protein phosphatase [Novosphingobium sp. JCM 18896]|uniref:tyrosine-protein phosphatase n=1 Tax=Novosphingobium sp. JCM 18896 TaxID=2989731 RepID=UPI00222333E8|nr:tyrosine-protein phosphatase [Novosphingobium sp. JCM 18896]MCW1430668.1 tyrosine-protein phosphatase [Novosphingobium sp. JCM 18896]